MFHTLSPMLLEHLQTPIRLSTFLTPARIQILSLHTDGIDDRVTQRTENKDTSRD